MGLRQALLHVALVMTCYSPSAVGFGRRRYSDYYGVRMRGATGANDVGGAVMFQSCDGMRV